ncbi:MAG: hypothetical protein AB1578_20075 [Thermodesulfobacteriota bacterium]
MSALAKELDALDAMRLAGLCLWCGDPADSHAVGCPALWPVNPWGPCTWCFSRFEHAANCPVMSALLND